MDCGKLWPYWTPVERHDVWENYLVFSSTNNKHNVVLIAFRGLVVVIMYCEMRAPVRRVTCIRVFEKYKREADIGMLFFWSSLEVLEVAGRLVTSSPSVKSWREIWSSWLQKSIVRTRWALVADECSMNVFKSWHISFTASMISSSKRSWESSFLSRSARRARTSSKATWVW